MYLTLGNIDKEDRHGQASINTIRCSNCFCLTTGKTIEIPDGSKKLEKNVRSVLDMCSKKLNISMKLIINIIL